MRGDLRWHSLSAEEVVKRLETDPESGLTWEEAGKRLEVYGPNAFEETKPPSAFKIFLDQFKSVLIIILLAATAISAALGEIVDAALIGVIVFFASLLGFVQEYRAEKSIEALKRMLSPKARVLREGAVAEVDAREVVPGDILVLEAGDRVAADGRLLQSRRLQVNEAPLTGESTPVDKHANPLPPETPLSDRRNMAFAGTIVTYGKGKAVVVATGMKTEFGKIAAHMMEIEAEKSPLEKKMSELGRWLGKIIVGVAALIIAIGLLKTFITSGALPPTYVLNVGLFGVALAVAVIPEALPAIVVGSLALAMRIMARRNALVRRMSGVETLGCITVICTDKTGTLTKGEMTVREIYVDDSRLRVTGTGYEPKGEIVCEEGSERGLEGEAFRLMMLGAVLCNEARLERGEGGWRIIGDPTEGALVVMAVKAGLNPEEVRKAHPVIDEVPFSSERKRMTTVNKMPDGRVFAFMKGAPEVVLERCNRILIDGVEKELSEEERKHFLGIAREMAERALRVLAFAYKPAKPGMKPEELESGMTFLGMAGMMDPPREDAMEAVKVCKRVGIKPVMITGDHKVTAVAVAKEMGIYRDGDIVLTGTELDRMSEKELEGVVEKVTVYARVSPGHKLKIVRAWKARGHVVAMTGDGVNDAPALKQADIGVAMGITGTEVAKEAADIILADDNFATIVKAIELGRWIYDNIKKFLAYLLQCNLVEIVVLATAFLALGRLPLEAKHILYINLATDGLPALALGFTPPDPDVMRRPPRNPKESIFTLDVTAFLVRAVMIEAPILLAVYFMAPIFHFKTHAEQLTVLFLTFIFVELVVALSSRSLTETIFKLRPHRWLVLAVVWELLLVFSIIYLIPGGAMVLEVEKIPLHDYGLIIFAALLVFASMEITKFLTHKVVVRRQELWRKEVIERLGVLEVGA